MVVRSLVFLLITSSYHFYLLLAILSPMTHLHYKRLLIKLSGEQLAGDKPGGIDTQVVETIAREFQKAQDIGAQLALIVGGGNYVRGSYFAGTPVSHVNADYMGMLAGMINALAVTDIFNAVGTPARVLSNASAPAFLDDFTPRRALTHLEKGRVVVIAGGMGRPNFTHDTAAVGMALELDCDVVCKATKVDGVYDKDPVKFEGAQRFERLSFQEALERPGIAVMDKAALGLAMEANKPLIVFGLAEPEGIARIAGGERVGTLVS